MNRPWHLKATDVNEPLPLTKVSEGNLSLRLTLNFIPRFFSPPRGEVIERCWGAGLGYGIGSVMKGEENEKMNRPILAHACI